ncbi:hydroxypyruvate isomerase [Sphingopyxis panaciterrae]|uniref:DUF3606 domain-containing protein n=1 Tax=Sphingopyxis panaciterrae TaxID=363841 RepID=UPI00141FB78F|nr:DUF3606 domain-containing protein [Sphingopyxis panaciterrae]NIJ36276.1 hydroxypyruvate isomerase [Sphingopyxis panaciterrae]
MQAQIVPDGGRINRSSVDAMRAWSAILGVTQVEILVAVAAVGPRYQDVQSYLAEDFCFSSREGETALAPVPPEARSLAA